MSTKVTDLDEFLDEIWRPFWPAHPDCGLGRPATRFASRMPESYAEGMNRMGRKRHTLDGTLDELRTHQNTEWHRMVISRIAACKFWFPGYIYHPLVRYIEAQIVELKAKE